VSGVRRDANWVTQISPRYERSSRNFREARVLVELTKKLVVAGVGALLATSAWGQCKTQAQPNFKDRAEYDLIESIKKEATPAKKLELLNQWKEKYPQTELLQARGQLFIQTYQQLNRPKDMVVAAKEMVADDPCSLIGLYFLNVLTISPDTSPEALDTGEKAANGLIANLDNIFAPAKKPAGATDELWTKERGNMEALARKTLGWIGLQRKQWEPAEKEFHRVLELAPNDGQVAYWEGTAVLSQRKPEKQASAIYFFARAASYEGEGGMAPAARTEARNYLEKIYQTYHGDKSGLDQLLATAKTSALPPDGWTLESIVDRQKKEALEAENLAKSNPQLALFLNVKKELTGADGAAYFENNMKGKALPEFEGTLVSTNPETKPKELVVGISGSTAEITVKLDAPLAGKMDPGAKIKFKDSVPESFTKEPFMLTVTAEKANISGWKGGPPPAPAKKAVTRKKAGKKR
jgi:hypothetical protein